MKNQDHSNTQWLKLGVVGRAHGLRGSFFVSGRDELIPSSVKAVRLGAAPASLGDFVVEDSLWQNGRAILKCKGVSDRTAAEKFTGQTVWCDAQQIRVNDQEEYLFSDIRGRVVKDSDGVTLGTVDDIYTTPGGGANLVVVNEAQTGDVEIPMVAIYVDMNFARGEPELKLVVPANTFEDVWNERRRKR